MSKNYLKMDFCRKDKNNIVLNQAIIKNKNHSVIFFKNRL